MPLPVIDVYVPVDVDDLRAGSPADEKRIGRRKPQGVTSSLDHDVLGPAEEAEASGGAFFIKDFQTIHQALKSGHRPCSSREKLYQARDALSICGGRRFRPDFPRKPLANPTLML